MLLLILMVTSGVALGLGNATFVYAEGGAYLKNDPEACSTRIVGGEHRAEVPDFVADTYNGGCAGLQPAANLGFRLVLEEGP